MHVAFTDALAYAQWAGKELPTEAEWEFAARGGLDGAEFAWGDELTPGGQHMANTWQGEFPRQNRNDDGFERTSPVTAFPPNGYGVHDMIGNVWEWTADWYSPKHEADAPKACCIPENPRGGREDGSYDPATTERQDSPQGHQGRLAPVRAELLPPLPAGCAPRGAGRHVHEPCRLPMHQARSRLMHHKQEGDVMSDCILNNSQPSIRDGLRKDMRAGMRDPAPRCSARRR